MVLKGNRMNKTERKSMKDFMRQRRPESFSDSMTVGNIVEDRSRLEYHLETVTNRSEEIGFGKFCVKLLQRCVAPNIMAPTGPMGGGDGKVDSETFPVSDPLSLLWIASDEVRDAAAERWAFAFSCKEKWKGKVESDIEKIHKTDRGYKSVFFISSRYISARTSHEMQDEMSSKYGFRVIILDRGWVLDRVMEGRYFDLFQSELGFTAKVESEIIVGDNDAEKIALISENERRIADINAAGTPGPEIARLCLESAIAMRGLERPREKVDAAFDRALRVAKKNGHKGNILECVYQMARTDALWHEDLDGFLKRYDEYRNLSSGSYCLYDIERLSSLWMILKSLMRDDRTPDGMKRIKKETSKLMSELRRFSSEDGMPATALHAKSMEAITALIESDGSKIQQSAKTLSGCLASGQSMLGYPVETIVEMITEMSFYLSGNSHFEALYEQALEISEKISGDGSAAKNLIIRGARELRGGRPSEALKFIGRSSEKAKNHESRGALSHSFYLQALAYEEMGLYWASRAAYLTATSIAMTDFWTYNEVTASQIRYLNRIKWTEIKLGNIAKAIRAFEIESICGRILRSDFDAEMEIQKDQMYFEGGVCVLIARLDRSQLISLSRAPDFLEKTGLTVASSVLLYALGHAADLPYDLGKAEEFLKRLQGNPIALQISNKPKVGTEPIQSYISHVCGCKIIISSNEADALLAFSRAILAFIESLMASSIGSNMAPRTPEMHVYVRRGGDIEQPATISYQDDKKFPEVHIECSVKCTEIPSRNAQSEISEIIKKCAIEVVIRAFVLGDQMEKVFGSDGGLSRAGYIASSLFAELKIFGQENSRWITSDGDHKEYELVRRTDIEHDVKFPKASEAKPKSKVIGSGPPPAELDIRKASHDNVTTSSIIRSHLWDRAKWRGIGFAYEEIPIIALVFENCGAAVELWKALAEDIGDDDSREKIRVSILKGISIKKPFAYRIAIGPGVGSFDEAPSGGFQYMMSRANTMEPVSGDNLKHLENEMAKKNAAYLMAGTFGSDGHPMNVSEARIRIKNVVIRNAYEVGPNDLDSAHVHEEDDVYIPVTVSKPPMRELFKRNRARR